MDLLYNEKTTVGRLASHFSQYFPHLTARTRRLLLWLLIAMLALGCCPSIRFLFRHFLKDAAPASQNCYYRACKHPGIDFQQIVKTNVQMALGVVPKELRNEPVFLSVDDTTIAKFGKKFEDAAVLLDHSDHTGHPYVNGHCFVSLTICVPTILVTRGVSRIHYVSVPVGYEMWRKDGNKNKLELAADLVDAVMPELDGRQVVLSFDSWYAKAKLLERLRGYRIFPLSPTFASIRQCTNAALHRQESAEDLGNVVREFSWMILTAVTAWGITLSAAAAS